MNPTIAAHHEAGHAVVGAVLGFAIIRASIYIIPEDDMHGEVRFWEPWSQPLFDRLVVHLAGPAAQLRFAPGNRTGFNGDKSQARARLREIAPSFHGDVESHPEYRRAESMAETLVSRYWGTICSVATALLQYETIYGRTLKEALCPS